MSSVLTQEIKGTDCIGDSRLTINLNFSALDLSVQELSGNLTSLSTTNLEVQTDLLILSGSVLDLETDLYTLSSNSETSIQTLSTTLENLLVQFNTENIGPSATLTTYVSSLSVYTSVGDYIGFIPIYIE